MKKLEKLKTEWDLSPLFKNDTDPKIAAERKRVEKASYAFINKWKDRTDYLEDPKILREALDEYNTWIETCGTGTEGYYFWLRNSLNQTDPKIKAKQQLAHDFAIKIGNDIQFFTIRISKIPESKQSLFLKNKDLSKYHHFLSDLFKEAKYVLTEPEEKILNLTASSAFGNWVKMTEEFISKEERILPDDAGTKKARNFEEILGFMSSTKKKVRDTAALAFNDILAKHSDVAEVEINSVLGTKKVGDGLRGYTRPDAARHLNDGIESEVVDTALETIAKRFNLAQRYYKLKAKLAGQKRLAYHERNMPYGSIERKISYQEAYDLTKQAFDKLDPSFGQLFEAFHRDGKVDVFPKKGKTNGAYCVHDSYDTNPTLVLLNHKGLIRDIQTVAHEFGHAINFELIKKNQPGIYRAMSLGTAEVPSTFMEDFVLEDLRKEAGDELRLALAMSKLNDDISTIFRQTSFYRFEQDLHANFRKQGYLSKKEIGLLFQKHTREYMGPAVEQSPGSENWWIYVSHFRRFFYVYSYATGLLISKSLQASVRQNPKHIEKVKEFFAAGTSDSPKNIFAKLGIDITSSAFWDQGLDEVEALLTTTEKLAKKLGKI